MGKTDDVGQPWEATDQGVILDREGEQVAVTVGSTPAVRRIYADRIVRAVNIHRGTEEGDEPRRRR